MISHVLHPFRGKDRETIDHVLAKAADAVEAWLKGASLSEMMENFNMKAPKKETCAGHEAGRKENAQ